MARILAALVAVAWLAQTSSGTPEVFGAGVLSRARSSVAPSRPTGARSISSGRPPPVRKSPVEDEGVARCRASRSDLRILGGVPGPSSDVYFLDVAIPARDGAAAHADIWQCARTPSGWGPPTPLPAGINTAAFETFPFFSPDGRDLFFVRGFRTFHRVALAEVLRSQ